MRTLRRLAGPVAIAAAVLTAIACASRSDNPRASARALTARAADAYARLQADSALDLLVAALEADPTYTAALYDIRANPRNLLAWRSHVRPRIERLIARDADTAARRCRLRFVEREHRPQLRFDTTSATSNGARECAEFHAVAHAGANESSDGVLQHTLSLWRRYPESVALTAALHGVALGDADAARATGIARAMQSGAATAFATIRGLTLEIQLLLKHQGRRDTLDVARRIERLLGPREGGLRYHYLLQRGVPRPSLFAQLAGADSAFALYHLQGSAYDLMSAGELRRSLAQWDTLIAAATRWRADDLLAAVLVGRGRTYVKLALMDSAEADLRRAQILAARVEDPALISEAAHNLLHVYEGQERWREAELAGAGFVEASAGVLPAQLLTAYHDLGWFYLRRNQRAKAAAYMARLIALTDSIRDYSGFAGEYLETIGELDRAMQYYERSGREPHPDQRRLVRLSALAEALGDTAAAMRYGREHDESEIHAYPEFAPVLPGLLARLGRMREADSAARRALARAERDGQTPAVARLLLDLATITRRGGDTAAATALARRAGSLARRLSDVRVELLAGATAGAPADSVARIVARARALGLPELELRLGELYADALAESGDVPGALAALARSASLAGTLAHSLGADLDRIRFRAAHVRISNRALALIVRDSLDPLRACRYLEWSSRRKDQDEAQPALPRASDCSAPRLVAMRRALAPGAALVDFVVLDSTVAALVITRAGATVHRLVVPPGELRALAAQLVSRLVVRLGGYLDVARARMDTLVASRLYDDLLLPLEARLGAPTALTIVPDDALYLLPFDALMWQDGRDARRRYVVERHRITLAPSLTAVVPDRAIARGRIVAVGYDPSGTLGAEAEVRMVAEVAASREVVRLAGAEATPEAVRHALGEVSVLHVAAHASPGITDPLYGYLALAPSGETDGRLRGYEAQGFPLAGVLVVLSACESASGQVFAGAGALSLSRAFARAGARGTVATLWPVGPASAPFMAAMYRELMRGRTPSEAVRTAKLAFLGGEFSHPVYWAGYVVTPAR